MTVADTDAKCAECFGTGYAGGFRENGDCLTCERAGAEAHIQELASRITFLEAQLAERWLPIERAQGGWCLVYTAKGHFIAFKRRDGSWFFDDGVEADEGREPTHWQPLPEPPAILSSEGSKGSASPQHEV